VSGGSRAQKRSGRPSRWSTRAPKSCARSGSSGIAASPEGHVEERLDPMPLGSTSQGATHHLMMSTSSSGFRRRNALRRKQCDLPLDLLRVEEKRDPRERGDLLGDGLDVGVLEREGPPCRSPGLQPIGTENLAIRGCTSLLKSANRSFAVSVWVPALKTISSFSASSSTSTGSPKRLPTAASSRRHTPERCPGIPTRGPAAAPRSRAPRRLS
jgi:hypothetical protein